MIYPYEIQCRKGFVTQKLHQICMHWKPSSSTSSCLFCCCCCLLLHSLLIYEYARKRLQKEFDSVRRPMLVNEIYLFPLHPFPSFSSSLLPNHKGVLCSEFSVAHLSWSGAEGGASWSYREKGRGQIWMESGALSVGKIV